MNDGSDKEICPAKDICDDYGRCAKSGCPQATPSNLHVFIIGENRSGKSVR